ncbi:MAG: DNA primase [Pseudomonadota bacterium]
MPRFSPQFLEELKSRLRPSEVVGRHVSLKKQGNEWAGLSPFTSEKTPSFFVNDQKAFWHCFSSGKSGDVISFLQETQNLSFTEAVEALASEAGMEIPKSSREDEEAQKKRLGLYEACEQAAVFFRTLLRRSAGSGALDYMKGRGLSEQALETFDIGFAPSERTALKDYLVNKGFSVDVLVEAGLLIRLEDGSAPYDRFRGRVMFPICDERGRVIAFGGRALDKNARAKYLNSPETPVFHKGATLYNFRNARAAVGDDAPLLVCEGYMDVIAVAEAGFETGVAPLGTALTEDQLAKLWRVSGEPVLCFDGDRAGLGAAHRAVDRALPLLKPGKSLRFAFLPAGKDPDDLIREEGAAAFREVLDRARPLVDVLWERERAVRPLDTPERKAAFRDGLRKLVQTIGDKDVRGAYGDELRARLEAERPAGRSNPFRREPYRPRDAFRGRGEPPAAERPLSKPAPQDRAWWRQGLLLLAVVARPELLERHEETFAALEFDFTDLEAVHAEILLALSSLEKLDTEGLTRHLAGSASASAWRRLDDDPRRKLEPLARCDAQGDAGDGAAETVEVRDVGPHANGGQEDASRLEEAEQGWLIAAEKHRSRILDDDQRRAARDSAGSEADEARWRASVAPRNR